MSENLTPSLRILFHIGAGKTGTTSIQHTLLHSAEALRQQGTMYLGLMLEHAPLVKYPWQTLHGSEMFHALPPGRAARELEEVLRACIDHAREQGLRQLIWSNESFFSREEKTQRVWRALMDSTGVDVRFVAYVRRHDAWLRSAYTQWGIKHKTYDGAIKPFAQWANDRPASFGPALSRVDKHFPGCLVVRNLDVAKDAVRDFCEVAGLDITQLSVYQSNVTPGTVELMLRALYNDVLATQVTPQQFSRSLLAAVEAPGSTASSYMNWLMPDESQMQAEVARTQEDRQRVNELLVQSGQPPLNVENSSYKPAAVNDSELLFAMTRVVVRQARQLDALQHQIKKLRADVDALQKAAAPSPNNNQEVK